MIATSLHSQEKETKRNVQKSLRVFRHNHARSNSQHEKTFSKTEIPNVNADDPIPRHDPI